MEFLLPSEIARLVYGYLEAEKCTEVAAAFLKTSQHLKEFHQFSLQNGHLSTTVMGFSLLQCLDLLCSVYRLVQSNISLLKNELPKTLSLLEQLNYLINLRHGSSFTQKESTISSKQRDDKAMKKVRGRSKAKETLKLGSKISITSVTSMSSDSPSIISHPPLTDIQSLDPVLSVPGTTSLESLPGTRRKRKQVLRSRCEKCLAADFRISEEIFEKPLPEKPKLQIKTVKYINNSMATVEKPNFGSNKVVTTVGKPNFGSNDLMTTIEKPNFESNNSMTTLERRNFGSNNSMTTEEMPNFRSNDLMTTVEKPNFRSNNSMTVDEKPNFGSNDSMTTIEEPNFGSNDKEKSPTSDNVIKHVNQVAEEDPLFIPEVFMMKKDVCVKSMMTGTSKPLNYVHIAPKVPSETQEKNVNNLKNLKPLLKLPTTSVIPAPAAYTPVQSPSISVLDSGQMCGPPRKSEVSADPSNINNSRSLDYITGDGSKQSESHSKVNQSNARPSTQVVSARKQRLQSPCLSKQTLPQSLNSSIIVVTNNRESTHAQPFVTQGVITQPVVSQPVDTQSSQVQPQYYTIMSNGDLLLLNTVAAEGQNCVQNIVVAEDGTKSMQSKSVSKKDVCKKPMMTATNCSLKFVPIAPKLSPECQKQNLKSVLKSHADFVVPCPQVLSSVNPPQELGPEKSSWSSQCKPQIYKKRKAQEPLVVEGGTANSMKKKSANCKEAGSFNGRESKPSNGKKKKLQKSSVVIGGNLNPINEDKSDFRKASLVNSKWPSKKRNQEMQEPFVILHDILHSVNRDGANFKKNDPVDSGDTAIAVAYQQLVEGIIGEDEEKWPEASVLSVDNVLEHAIGSGVSLSNPIVKFHSSERAAEEVSFVANVVEPAAGCGVISSSLCQEKAVEKVSSVASVVEQAVKSGVSLSSSCEGKAFEKVLRAEISSATNLLVCDMDSRRPVRGRTSKIKNPVLESAIEKRPRGRPKGMHKRTCCRKDDFRNHLHLESGPRNSLFRLCRKKIVPMSSNSKAAGIVSDLQSSNTLIINDKKRVLESEISCKNNLNSSKRKKALKNKRSLVKKNGGLSFYRKVDLEEVELGRCEIVNEKDEELTNWELDYKTILSSCKNVGNNDEKLQSSSKAYLNNELEGFESQVQEKEDLALKSKTVVEEDEELPCSSEADLGNGSEYLKTQVPEDEEWKEDCEIKIECSEDLVENDEELSSNSEVDLKIKSESSGRPVSKNEELPENQAEKARWPVVLTQVMVEHSCGAIPKRFLATQGRTEYEIDEGMSNKMKSTCVGEISNVQETFRTEEIVDTKEIFTINENVDLEDTLNIKETPSVEETPSNISQTLNDDETVTIEKTPKMEIILQVNDAPKEGTSHAGEVDCVMAKMFSKHTYVRISDDSRSFESESIHNSSQSVEVPDEGRPTVTLEDHDKILLTPQIVSVFGMEEQIPNRLETAEGELNVKVSPTQTEDVIPAGAKKLWSTVKSPSEEKVLRIVGDELDVVVNSQKTMKILPGQSYQQMESRFLIEQFLLSRGYQFEGRTLSITEH